MRTGSVRAMLVRMDVLYWFVDPSNIAIIISSRKPRSVDRSG